MTFVEEDIAAALQAAGYSNIRTQFDESSAAQIGIFTGGGSSIHYLGGTYTQKPRVQIQVRASGCDATATRAAKATVLAIRDLLHGNTTVTNSLGIVWDGREPDRFTDQNGRAIFSVEFSIIRR